MRKFIRYITGLSRVSSRDVGRILLYLVAFVPYIYKLISPFFILAGLSSLTVIIMPTLVFLGIVMCWPNLKVAMSPAGVTAYLLITILLAFSPVVHIDIIPFFEKNYLTFIFTVLPFLFVGLLIDYERDWKILRFVSRMGVLVQLFWQTCLLLGLVETDLGSEESLGEQMESAYQLLFPIVLLMISISREKTLIDLILGIIGTILLFFMGARGPIVVFLVFLLGYLVIFKSYKTYAFFKKCGVIICFGIICYFLQEILLSILPWAESLGFSTRVFDSILNNQMVSLEDSSNRDSFYGSVFRAIFADSTGFGYGWGGDRLFTPTKGYAHNLELELLCQFGYIGGSILLFCILWFTFRRYRYSKKEKTETVWYALFCCGFMALQFSYTYVQYPLFFVFLGYMMNKRICNYTLRQ